MGETNNMTTTTRNLLQGLKGFELCEPLICRRVSEKQVHRPRLILKPQNIEGRGKGLCP